jgi:PKD repeat protein
LPIGANEQCEINQTGCDASCQWINPVCPVDLVFDPTLGTPGQVVVATRTIASGLTALQLDWNDNLIIANPASGTTHTFNVVGTYTPILTIANAGNTGITLSCTGSVQITNASIP